MELSKLNKRSIAVEVAPGEFLNVTRRVVTIADQEALQAKQREIRRRVLEIGKEIAAKTKEKANDSDGFDLSMSVIEMEERAAQEVEKQGNVTVLLDILTGWDLEDGGKQVGLQDTLPSLDSRIIKLIHDAVWEDINPNPTKP